MRNHVISIALGVATALVGLALWRFAGDIEIPVVTLTKVGVVLMVLGVAEILISGSALARPSTRHQNEPL